MIIKKHVKINRSVRTFLPRQTSLQTANFLIERCQRSIRIRIKSRLHYTLYFGGEYILSKYHIILYNSNGSTEQCIEWLTCGKKTMAQFK